MARFWPLVPRPRDLREAVRSGLYGRQYDETASAARARAPAGQPRPIIRAQGHRPGTLRSRSGQIAFRADRVPGRLASGCRSVGGRSCRGQESPHGERHDASGPPVVRFARFATSGAAASPATVVIVVAQLPWMHPITHDHGPGRKGPAAGGIRGAAGTLSGSAASRPPRFGGVAPAQATPPQRSRGCGSGSMAPCWRARQPGAEEGRGQRVGDDPGQPGGPAEGRTRSYSMSPRARARLTASARL